MLTSLDPRGPLIEPSMSSHLSHPVPSAIIFSLPLLFLLLFLLLLLLSRHPCHPGDPSPSPRLLLLLLLIIRRDRPLATNHPEGPASYKWSSGGASLLQLIIQRDRTLANDQSEGPMQITIRDPVTLGSRFYLADLSRTICTCFPLWLGVSKSNLWQFFNYIKRLLLFYLKKTYLLGLFYRNKKIGPCPRLTTYLTPFLCLFHHTQNIFP